MVRYSPARGRRISAHPERRGQRANNGVRATFVRKGTLVALSRESNDRVAVAQIVKSRSTVSG
jgi:hypothetical protein